MSTAYDSPARRRASRLLPGTQTLRWLLLLAVLASGAASLWSWPRDSSPEQLAAAHRAGDVRAVAQGSVSTIGRYWALDQEAGNGDLVWQDSLLRVHTTERTQELSDLLALPAAWQGREDLRPWDPKGRVDTDLTPPLAALALLSSVLALVLLVRGPQPRRATKWAWFWVGALVPLGLGILLWLLTEVPWSRRAGRLPDPRGRWTRFERRLQAKAVKKGRIRRLDGFVQPPNDTRVTSPVAIPLAALALLVLGFLLGADWA